jgi:hypothetical protein
MQYTCSFPHSIMGESLDNRSYPNPGHCCDVVRRWPSFQEKERWWRHPKKSGWWKAGGGSSIKTGLRVINWIWASPEPAIRPPCSGVLPPCSDQEGVWKMWRENVSSELLCLISESPTLRLAISVQCLSGANVVWHEMTARNEMWNGLLEAATLLPVLNLPDRIGDTL